MLLVDQPFETTFAFSRAGPAAYVDATGAAATAPNGAPRFDHDAEGQARGLLVEGRPDYWRPDSLQVRDGDWAQPGGTVLHVFETPEGETRQTAWYAPTDPLSAVNACLSAKGRHQLIAYVPGFLRNRGGYVMWRRRAHVLGGILLSEPGIAIGAADTIPLLEG